MPKTTPNKEMDLLQGPIFSTLLMFALPTLLANILQSLNGSINSIWVGRFLGEKALAATGNATVNLFLVFSLIFGFGIAATVGVGRALGHKDLDKAQEVFGAALSLSLILSLLFMLLGVYFADEILHFMHTADDIFSLSRSYLQVLFLSMPGLVLLLMITSALRGLGDSMTPLWFIIINVVLDITLNPLFILGLGGLPKLGIAGSAMATVVASYTALLLLVGYLYWRGSILCLKGKTLRYLWPKASIIGSLFAQGLAMALQMIVVSTSTVIFVSRVNIEGVETLAAYNIMQQIWSYLQMPAIAIGAAVSAMAAQNIGSGAWDRVFKITRAGIFISIIITVTLLTITAIFGNDLARLFLGDEPQALAIAQHIQKVSSWSYIFIAIQLVISGTLRANRAVMVPLLAMIISLYPVRSLLYTYLHPTWHADAIWFSFAVTNSLCCLLIWIYYWTPLWRKTKKQG